MPAVRHSSPGPEGVPAHDPQIELALADPPLDRLRIGDLKLDIDAGISWPGNAAMIPGSTYIPGVVLAPIKSDP